MTIPGFFNSTLQFQKQVLTEREDAIVNSAQTADKLKRNATIIRHIADTDLKGFQNIYTAIKDRTGSETGDVSVLKNIDKSIIFGNEERPYAATITKIKEKISTATPLNFAYINFPADDSGEPFIPFNTKEFQDGTNEHLNGLNYKEEPTLTVAIAEERLNLFNDFLKGWATHAEYTAKEIIAFASPFNSEYTDFIKEQGLLEFVIKFKDTLDPKYIEKIIKAVGNNAALLDTILVNIVTDSNDKITETLNALTSHYDPTGNILNFLTKYPDILITRTNVPLQEKFILQALKILIAGPDLISIPKEQRDEVKVTLAFSTLDKAFGESFNSILPQLETLENDTNYEGSPVASSITDKFYEKYGEENWERDCVSSAPGEAEEDASFFPAAPLTPPESDNSSGE